MNKKLLALMLSAVMAAAAVSGCSSSKKETEAPKQETEVQTEAKTEAVAPETEAAAEEEAVSEAAETIEEAATEAEAAEEAAVETEAAEEAAEIETEIVEEAAAETEAAEEAAVETEAAEEAAEIETEIVEEAAAEEAAAEEVAEIETEAAEEVAEIETEVAEEVAEIETEAAEVIVEIETEAAEVIVEVETEAAAEEIAETEEATEEATEEPVVYQVVVEDESVIGSYADRQISDSDIVILYTNDVHGGISADVNYSGSDTSLGYAGLAAVKAEAEADAAAVTLVDNGDAIQGSVVATESDGHDIMTLMDLVGYDIRIPGNHEFDFGMDAFLEYANSCNCPYISSNFIDLTTGEAVLDKYTLVDYTVNDEVVTIGYVGMSTPETIAKSTPTYFQDEDGNYIYGFDADTPQEFYDDIQASIDAAYKDGADFVIGLSHLGDTGVEADWSSIAVAANTTGLNIILDGHAHSVLPGEIVTNLDGEDVLISSTGTKLNNIGLLKLTMEEDGTVLASTGLIDTLSDEELASDAYAEVADVVAEIEEGYAYLFIVEGTTDYDLVIYDPSTEDRIVRKQETNLGDFLADAYRIVYDNEIGMINGGSIRANVSSGDINFINLLTVFPWNTEYSVVEVSGQVVLDALEMGAHLYPEECGGFLQVSGLTYKIDTTIPSSVNVNSDGEFVSVDGEYRVKDVMVGDEPLDLDRIYRLGINTYYSKDYGDGMTMFKDAKFVFPVDEAAESAEEESTEAEEDADAGIPAEPVIDYEVIIAYLESLGGVVPEEYADPYGQGRITLITEETMLAEAVEELGEAVAEEISELEIAADEAAALAEEALAELGSEAEAALEELESEAGAAVEEAAAALETLLEVETEAETK